MIGHIGLSKTKALQHQLYKLKVLVLDDFIGALSQDANWLENGGKNHRIYKRPSIAIFQSELLLPFRPALTWGEMDSQRLV